MVKSWCFSILFDSIYQNACDNMLANTVLYNCDVHSSVQLITRPNWLAKTSSPAKSNHVESTDVSLLEQLTDKINSVLLLYKLCFAPLMLNSVCLAQAKEGQEEAAGCTSCSPQD